MRLFRRKDKNHYLKNIQTVFTDTFTKSLLPGHSQDISLQMEDIIKSKRHMEEYERE